MKTNTGRLFMSLAILMATSLFYSCSDDPKGTATLQVALIDEAGDFEKVEIEILDVQINAATDEAGFESLAEVNTGVFDILTLTGGLEAILADVELPAGRVSQIRLILGDNNVLTIATDVPGVVET